VGCMRCRRAVFGRRSASFVRFRPFLAVAALVVLGLPASARADGSFGRLFPGLPALSGQSAQQIADLAQTQLDPNADSGNNCQRPAVAGSSCLPSGFTYFGQDVDHDLTLDTSPSPTSPIDPATIPNGRTFRLDLDSVYGGGPLVSPQLYEADGKHFKTQADNGNGVPDLPRNPDGSAILVEGRNDENEIISQIHNAFLRSHNRLIDEGKSFAEAQKFLTLHYQWIVLHDYLPHILGPDVETKGIRRMDARLHAAAPRTTMDAFSVAAFRFGHSQVRLAYELNETSGKIQVFSFTLPDLRGGRQQRACLPEHDSREVLWDAVWAVCRCGSWFAGDPAVTFGARAGVGGWDASLVLHSRGVGDRGGRPDAWSCRVGDCSRHLRCCPRARSQVDYAVGEAFPAGSGVRGPGWRRDDQ
jgi:hypothetical protein